MLLNKDRSLKYLGFNDFWFLTIGILILSFITAFLFNDSLGRQPILNDVISWLISLLFTVCNWFFMRYAVIYSRIKMPSFEDSLKRIILLFVILVVSVITINEFGNFIISIIAGENYHPAHTSRIILPVVLISTMIQAIYEAIYYYVRLKKSVREEEQAKQAVVQAQLDALRNQAQPHFFFNTMNTLRDIIDQNTKEEAKYFVDKLSDIYRYILETGNENLISLHDEIQFSKAYIHIQKERFGENLNVAWNINESNYTDQVAPMSVQLLLENAIKHNVVSRSHPLTIEVYIQADQLIVHNKMRLKSTALTSTKMGLKNIDKRYTLLTDRKVIIENNNEAFTVKLPLIHK